MRSTLFKACLLALVVFGSPAFNWTADAASVGLNGYTNDFSVVPAPADWSGVSVGSSSGTISTSAGLDAAVQALSASGVTSPLASDPLDPPGAGGTPQWSSTGFYVQTRPTGVDASFLMCTLINNIGGNASGVTILYDFKTALPVVEEVLGHRAFYSLTGAAGSWVNIPAFSSASDGRLTATITLNWPNGGTLYLLWADDNGSGTPDTACQIDNFSAKAISAVGMPVAISSQPQNQIAAERGPATFSVVATGNPAPTYQWFKDGDTILGATNATYSIPSVPFSYNGAHFQVQAANTVSNVNYSVLSSNAILTVNPDVTPPTVTRLSPPAGATINSFDSIEVVFSEAVNGVNPSDLLINGQPATNIIFGIPGQFVFEFATPATGTVTVAWANNHGIVDTAATPNPFVAPAPWTYTFDPNSFPTTFLINEFLASNNKGLTDEDGDDPDWIELLNPGQVAGNLGGWYLTDDPLNLTKWQFPYRVLDPGAYLLVFASGKNRTNLVAGTIFTNLHANFQLSASGGYLALVDPQTNVINAFAPSYPPQSVNISYGRDRLDPDQVGYFATPTPRAPNSTSGAGIAPEVNFSRESGTFLATSPFDLSLSTISSNAVIYYAFGTNLPGTNTIQYTNGSPLRIDNTFAIRARAFEPGKLPGPITTKFYCMLANQTNVINFSSGLPIMILHNYGQGIVPASKTDQYVFIEVFDNDLGYASMTNVPNLTARGDFHVRGSSTAVASTSKSQFFLELRDEFDDGRSVPLLGLPSESDWVLYAPNNFEPALFHNPLAHALYRDSGQYGSRTRFFEMYLKDDSGTPGSVGSTEYQGIYVLEEKIKRDDNRVNISKLDVEDVNYPAVTGGYVLAIDRANSGEATVTGLNFSSPAPIVYVSPNGFAFTNAARAPQATYVRNYLNAFNTDLNGVNWTNTSTTNYYGNYINVDQWVNFHIHEVVTFNVDGFRLSGYFYKDRLKPIEYGPTWDYDRTQGSTDGRDINPRVWRSASGDLGTDFFNFTPWWQRLLSSPDFWQKWIDRYQELRQPGGALSTNNVFAHIQDYYNTLAPEQPREQAKWGIVPRQTNAAANGTYFTEAGWKGHWYGARLDFADTNFLAPPSFNFGPGPLSSPVSLTITPAAGLGDKPASTQLILTLDGTDPRLPGGAILNGPNVLSNTGPITVSISNSVRIFARSRNTSHANLIGANNPPITSPWSGPTIGTYYFSNAIPPLRITEIMYHPPKPAAGNTNDADNFEYIEFKNIGGTPLNVNRFRLRGGVDFDFPNIVLSAGQVCLVVANTGSFSSRYNTNGLLIAGVYTNRLNNAGDHLKLEGSVHEPILDFDFKDTWYPVTDGNGFSLQIVDENLPTSAWGLKSSWRASGQVNGTPGTADPGAVNVATIYINEILTHTDPPLTDAIELYNPTGGSVNIGGWFLTDEFDSPKKYRITNGTSVAANGYLVFYASNSFGNIFNLSSHGEEVYLFSGDANTNLTGYVHGFDFGVQANGVTFGRYVKSTGNEDFPTQVTPTLGAANAGPKVGPIVISEINYHPPDTATVEGFHNNTMDEYIKLENITGVAQPLFDPNYPSNTFHLRNAVNYTFPTNVTIPANGNILVVGFDPTNSFLAGRFRAAYHIPGGTPLFGPFDGDLDNAGESVELSRPDVPEPPTAPDAGSVYYILADKVNYEDQAPWPAGADGFGLVLRRIVLSSYGNDATNWVAILPGNYVPGDTAPFFTNAPLSRVVPTSTDVFLSAGATGSPPLRYQWRFSGLNLAGATNSLLILTNFQATQAGNYDILVYNNAGSAVTNFTLTSRIGLKVVTPPVNVFATNGANTNFTVVATGSGVLHFQWQFNGSDIPNANSSVLLLTNVSVANEGNYTCRVTDDFDSFTTPAVFFMIIERPRFTLQPIGTNYGVAGGGVTFTVAASGIPTPSYRWRKSSTLTNGSPNVAAILITSGFSSLTLTNISSANEGIYDVVVTNLAGSAIGGKQPGISSNAVLVVLVDSDGNGLPDIYQTNYAAHPCFTNNLAGDALRDDDADGMSNLAEYIAGTDPCDPVSNLKSFLTGAGNGAVQFTAVSNRTYSVQYSDDLNSTLWHRLADVPAKTTNRTESVLDPTPRTNRLYRIVTPLQP